MKLARPLTCDHWWMLSTLWGPRVTCCRCGICPEDLLSWPLPERVLS